MKSDSARRSYNIDGYLVSYRQAGCPWPLVVDYSALVVRGAGSLVAVPRGD